MKKIKQREWSYVVMLGISISLFIIGWKLELIPLEPSVSGTQAEFGDGYREPEGLKWLREFLHLSDPSGESLVTEQSFLGEEAGTDGLSENFGQEAGVGSLSGNPGQEAGADGSSGSLEQEAGADSLSENSLQGEKADGTSENSLHKNENMTTVSQNRVEASGEENTEEERFMGASEPFQADTTYFDDALFIGDSRTVGLMEYGNLGQAEVLADSGMSVYKVRGTSFPLRSGEKMNLEELLASRQFGKVYIMLGINELGYDFDQNVKRYREIVELIQRTQPNALIFVEANLHITKTKSDVSPYYNNENIDRFNHAVSEMADGKTIFYLDVNPLFDDEGGALDSRFTTDNAHILGKYYSTWVDWILTQAR